MSDSFPTPSKLLIIASVLVIGVALAAIEQ